MSNSLGINLLLGLTVFVVYWSIFRSARRRMKRIKGDQLAQLIEQGQPLSIVDVRTPEEYQKGRIPGSKLVPLDKLPQRLQQLDPQHEWIIVCQSGARATNAYRFLQQKGYRKLYLLEGGVKAYPGKLQR